MLGSWVGRLRGMIGRAARGGSPQVMIPFEAGDLTLAHPVGWLAVSRPPETARAEDGIRVVTLRGPASGLLTLMRLPGEVGLSLEKYARDQAARRAEALLDIRRGRAFCLLRARRSRFRPAPLAVGGRELEGLVETYAVSAPLFYLRHEVRYALLADHARTVVIMAYLAVRDRARVEPDLEAILRSIRLLPPPIDPGDDWGDDDGPGWDDGGPEAWIDEPELVGVG